MSHITMYFVIEFVYLLKCFVGYVATILCHCVLNFIFDKKKHSILVITIYVSLILQVIDHCWKITVTEKNQSFC